MNSIIELNPKIKFIAVEAMAGSMYLLASIDFPGYCLQVVVGTNQDESQDELLLIDRVTTFNCFTELSENDNIKSGFIQRLSDDSLKKINAIFGYQDKQELDKYNLQF